MGAGCLAMLGILSAHIAALVAALVAALSVTGFGIGPIVTAITSALLGSVDKSRSGIAAGTLPAFRQTGIWWCAVAVPWLIAVWALGSLYLSLGPSLAAQVLGSPNRP
jgi:MFS transporter, DHA2 family, methylenomycin A resistance protein